ncbi:sugar phosphate isomerase/epimerase [Sporolactobacillus sp. THM19-2]|jgi:sugar phosphate isomerase/epimerase|nr:sugar phosphate isomerase/epimerase [Sporolactobacillus sp. THM19-2]
MHHGPDGGTFPDGHEYSYDELSCVHRVETRQEKLRKRGRVMPFIRLKCGLDSRQLADRLKYLPEIIELQLTEEDLQKPQELLDTLFQLKQAGIKVYLHQPVTCRQIRLDIMSRNPEITSYYQWSCRRLADLCRRADVLCVIHAHYSRSESSLLSGRSASRNMRTRIEKLVQNDGDCFLWENTTAGLFSFANPYALSEIIEPLHLALCLDISHAFISLKGSNRRLKQVTEQVEKQVRYFHLVDSAGKRHDALPLGKGKIDWINLKPLLIHKDFIFEIGLKDNNDCRPMIESAQYFSRLPSA